MASIQFDEEVFCKHLSKFYESWKAVSLLATPCNCNTMLSPYFVP